MGLVCEINVKWPCVCFCTQSTVIAVKLDSAEVCRSLEKVMGGVKVKRAFTPGLRNMTLTYLCLSLCFCKQAPDFRFNSSLFSKGVCILSGKESGAGVVSHVCSS